MPSLLRVQSRRKWIMPSTIKGESFDWFCSGLLYMEIYCKKMKQQWPFWRYKGIIVSLEWKRSFPRAKFISIYSCLLRFGCRQWRYHNSVWAIASLWTSENSVADPFQSTAWVACVTALSELVFSSIFLWMVQGLYRLNWRAVHACLGCARKKLEGCHSTEPKVLSIWMKAVLQLLELEMFVFRTLVNSLW